MGSRWQDTGAPRGDAYDARWRKLAAAGQSIHGEADLIESLLRETGGSRVLDAGCGTGRVATELAARGFSVVGIDLDDDMLDDRAGKSTRTAVDSRRSRRGNRPSDRRVRRRRDGGNVMIFVRRAAPKVACCSS